jgi:stage II sporulation protein B
MDQNRNGQEEVQAVDKHGKTITIKINGKDRPVKEENRTTPEEENPSFHNDREEAMSETAAAKEQAEDSFDWILPDPVDTEPVKEYKIAPKQTKPQKKSIGISVWNKKTPRNNRLYTTIFVTVFLAVLLGTAFGVTILKFVTGETEQAGPVITTETPAQNETPSPGNTSVQLNPISAFVIQNGIFTTEEAAKDRINLLSGQGIEGEVFPVNGQFAIYLGTAGNIEEAKEISNTLKAKGVEVFAKQVDIQGGTASEVGADEAKFLQQAPEIYSILVTGKADTPELQKKITEYQVMLSEMTDKNIKDKDVLKAKASIERASKAFSDYQKSKDAAQLSSMQTDLLAFLSAYQSLGN